MNENLEDAVCFDPTETSYILENYYEDRSSRPEVFCKKDILRNLVKFTGKHLCQSLFFYEVAGGARNFIKKETLAQVFSCEFWKYSNNTFFTEHLWATASIKSQKPALCNASQFPHI